MCHGALSFNLTTAVARYDGLMSAPRKLLFRHFAYTNVVRPVARQVVFIGIVAVGVLVVISSLMSGHFHSRKTVDSLEAGYRGDGYTIIGIGDKLQEHMYEAPRR